MSSAYPFLLWWSWECVLYLIFIIKPEVWIINHCLGLGHETMVCAVCLTMLLYHWRHSFWKYYLQNAIHSVRPWRVKHSVEVWFSLHYWVANISWNQYFSLLRNKGLFQKVWRYDWTPGSDFRFVTKKRIVESAATLVGICESRDTLIAEMAMVTRGDKHPL